METRGRAAGEAEDEGHEARRGNLKRKLLAHAPKVRGRGHGTCHVLCART